MKKGIVITIGILFLVLVIGVIVVITFVSNKIKASEAEVIEVHSVDLSQIEDGTYIGEYSIFPVSAKVEVVVEDHQIMDVVILKHFNGQGAAAESIVDDVVKAQSLEVDCISGATQSSNVILKSVEMALIGE